MSVVILTPEQRRELLATLHRDYNYRAVRERLTWRQYLAGHGISQLSIACEDARWRINAASPRGRVPAHWAFSLMGWYAPQEQVARILAGTSADYRSAYRAFESVHGARAENYVRYLEAHAPHTRKWAQRLVQARAYLRAVEAA